MENLTGGTPPVRYLPCVVPCKLYFIQDKIKILEEKGYNFNCEYTNMVIEKVKETFECYPELNGCKTFEEVNAILNNYYETDFKESYGIFVNEIVMEVLAHINPLKN